MYIYIYNILPLSVHYYQEVIFLLLLISKQIHIIYTHIIYTSACIYVYTYVYMNVYIYMYIYIYYIYKYMYIYIYIVYHIHDICIYVYVSILLRDCYQLF